MSTAVVVAAVGRQFVGTDRMILFAATTVQKKDIL